ncbi:MAG: hypothetical protein WC781_04625 [Candidatus Pacearchaeota archaeon]|jgi:hypothetical protein
MKTQEIDFRQVLTEDPSEALKNLSEYFAGFKKQLLRGPKTVNNDDRYYSTNHRLTELLDSERNPTGLCIYDKEIYCRGCNCGVDDNILELRRMNRIDEIFDVSVETPHALTRNFLVGLTMGNPLVEINTWHENSPTKVRDARLRAYGPTIEELRPDYEATLELIRQIRSGS